MTSARRNAAFLAAAFVLSACQHPPDSAIEAPAGLAQAPVPQKHNDTVGIGDVLDLYVMEDSSLNGQFQVHESGNIVIPRIGRVHVAGSTLSAAQDQVRGRVQSDQIKKATVIVERVRTSEQASIAEQPKLLVFISGAVAKPGQHRIPLQSQGGLTAFEALMTAGGATIYADQRHSYILRKTGSGDRMRLPVDLLAVSRGEARDTQLQDSDVIVVPQRRFGL